MATLQFSAPSIEDRVVYADTSKTNEFDKDCSVITGTDSDYTVKSTANQIVSASISFASYYNSTWTPTVQVSYTLQALKNGNWVNVGFSGSQTISKSSTTYSETKLISHIDGLFGSNMPLRVHFVLARTGGDYYRAQAWVTNIRVNINYTPKSWVTFGGTNVTDTTPTAYELYENPTAPTVGNGITARTGWTFVGWSTSSSATSASDALPSIPRTNGTDVTYYACWDKTPYIIGLMLFDNHNHQITPLQQYPAPAISGLGQHVIDGDTFSIIHPYDPDGGGADLYEYDADTTYRFDYFQIVRIVDGAVIVLDNLAEYGYNDSRLQNLTVNATLINRWFSSSDTVYVCAYYTRVYDVSFSLLGANQTLDPTGVGHLGLDTLSVYDGWGGSPTQLFSFGHDDLFGDDGWVNTESPQIRVDVELTSASEYMLSVDDIVLTNMVEDTSKRTAVGNVTSLYYTLQTSASNMDVCILQKFFSLTLLNNTDNAVKVYRDGAQILPSSLSRIARGTPAVIIDARESATSDTQYNATLTSNTGVVITDNGHLGTIASIVKDHVVTVAPTQATFNVTTIINNIEQPTATAVRTEPYSFNLAAQTGCTLSGVLTMGGSQLQSWSGVTSIQYTIAHVTAAVTLNVVESNDPTAWVRLDISDCPHGSISVENNTLFIDKEQFTNFKITGIATDTNYEIVGTTYEWLVDGTSVGGGAISSIPSTITYSGAMPSGVAVVCAVHVQFRRNALYLTQHESNIFIRKQPSSLWYTAPGNSPEKVWAVYVQTQSHTSPMLIYSDPVRAPIEMPSDTSGLLTFNYKAFVNHKTVTATMYRVSDVIMSENDIDGATLYYSINGTESSLTIDKTTMHPRGGYGNYADGPGGVWTGAFDHQQNQYVTDHWPGYRLMMIRSNNSANGVFADCASSNNLLNYPSKGIWFASYTSNNETVRVTRLQLPDRVITE